jgi:hypothetical protein
MKSEAISGLFTGILITLPKKWFAVRDSGRLLIAQRFIPGSRGIWVSSPYGGRLTKTYYMQSATVLRSAVRYTDWALIGDAFPALQVLGY